MSRPPPHQVLSQESMLAFLEHLRQTGNITLSAHAIGATTTTVFNWKNRSKRDRTAERYMIRDPLGEDPDVAFYDAWIAAEEQSVHKVHDEAMTLATGYQDPVIYQGKLAFKPDYTKEYRIDPITGMAYYPPETDPITGEPVVLTVRRVSERMIGDILKARHPDYRPKLDVDLTTQGRPFAVPGQAVDMKEFLAAFGRKPETE